MKRSLLTLVKSCFYRKIDEHIDLSDRHLTRRRDSISRDKKPCRILYLKKPLETESAIKTTQLELNKEKLEELSSERLPLVSLENSSRCAKRKWRRDLLTVNRWFDRTQQWGTNRRIRRSTLNTQRDSLSMISIEYVSSARYIHSILLTEKCVERLVSFGMEGRIGQTSFISLVYHRGCRQNDRHFIPSRFQFLHSSVDVPLESDQIRSVLFSGDFLLISIRESFSIGSEFVDIYCWCCCRDLNHC